MSNLVHIFSVLCMFFVKLWQIGAYDFTQFFVNRDHFKIAWYILRAGRKWPRIYQVILKWSDTKNIFYHFVFCLSECEKQNAKKSVLFIFQEIPRFKIFISQMIVLNLGILWTRHKWLNLFPVQNIHEPWTCFALLKPFGAFLSFCLSWAGNTNILYLEFSFAILCFLLCLNQDLGWRWVLQWQ